MSVKEALGESTESNVDEILSRVHELEWIDRKKKTIRSQRLFNTVLVGIAFILTTLLIKILPVSDAIRVDLFQSWQFVSVLFIGFALVLYRIWADAFIQDSVSFVELDERNRYENLAYSKLNPNWIYRVQPKSDERKGVNEEVPTKKLSSHSFVDNMRMIIESLDKQITYAEEKASRLLEVGRTFVRGGISLYILSIVIWQGYLYYINFEFNAGIIVGMVSTTMIFLVMEFLGAWYLKQYRHYGDSAFSYMKVRSSYNKYLLAFCAIFEYTTDDYSKAQEEMLRVLAVPENWPDIKDVNSNDFNYMLQSVEAIGTIFERLKGVLGRSNNASNNGAQG